LYNIKKRWNFTEINEDDGKKSIPFQLQRLFLNLQTSNKKSIQTSDLTKSFGWNSDDGMFIFKYFQIIK
jgi:ubiquitin carboxyl-terminal hydrolase 47